MEECCDVRIKYCISKYRASAPRHVQVQPVRSPLIIMEEAGRRHNIQWTGQNVRWQGAAVRAQRGPPAASNLTQWLVVVKRKLNLES